MLEPVVDEISISETLLRADAVVTRPAAPSMFVPAAAWETENVFSELNEICPTTIDVSAVVSAARVLAVPRAVVPSTARAVSMVVPAFAVAVSAMLMSLPVALVRIIPDLSALRVAVTPVLADLSLIAVIAVESASPLPAVSEKVTVSAVLLSLLMVNA